MSYIMYHHGNSHMYSPWIVNVKCDWLRRSLWRLPEEGFWEERKRGRKGRERESMGMTLHYRLALTHFHPSSWCPGEKPLAVSEPVYHHTRAYTIRSLNADIHTLWLKYFSNLTLASFRQPGQSNGRDWSSFTTFTTPSGDPPSFNSCAWTNHLYITVTAVTRPPLMAHLLSAVAVFRHCTPESVADLEQCAERRVAIPELGVHRRSLGKEVLKLQC